MRQIEAVIAVVFRAGRILICQRKPEDHLGGYWEFPGGKIEPPETLEQCLSRELREELDIEAEAVWRLPVIEHDYPDVHVRLHPFLCAHKSGEPKALACAQAVWVPATELPTYQFPPANDGLIDQIIHSPLAASIAPE